MSTNNSIINEANSYLNTITKSFASKKFDNKFLLNLTTMSLEKFMVGYLMAQDHLPEHHTLGFLAGEMTRYTQLPLADIDLLEQLDDKIQLCSLDAAAPAWIPTDQEMTTLIEMLKRFQTLTQQVGS